MNELSDQHLLRDFAKCRSEMAFAEIVRRHVDLVYSAALRMVRDPQTAQDLTQAVFLALAEQAPRLVNHPVLSGWLHCTARNLASKNIRSDLRRCAREQEAVAMNEIIATDSDAVWKEIAPHLDDALGELSQPDRDALLLRYFERKSAREMAQSLGITDDAAQKRVSRAVERLREYFSKNGIDIGSGGFVALLSANAVQAAPVALSATISAAAAVGIAVKTTETIAAGKILLMTTAQKILVTTTIAAALGAGIYEMKQSSNLRNELLQSQQKQKPLADENAQLRLERDKATAELALVQQDNARLQKATAELPKLRGVASLLQENTRQLAQLKAGAKTNNNMADMVAKMMDSPAWKKQMRDMAIKTTKEKYASILKTLNLTPEEQEKLLGIMADQQSLAMEKGMAFLKGGDKNEVGKEMLADKEKLNGEMKTLLGDERFGQLRDFEKTLPDQNSVAQFKKELAKNPMTGTQEKQLLDAMVEERASVAKLHSPDSAAWDKFTSGATQKHIDSQEQRDLKVLSRAATFLDAEQLKALTDFQAKNIESLKTTMKMRESFLGGKTN
ncbi:MAG: sigma-70 family RNA polymerase sigma factor [Verrucomicrobiota bacterium]